MLVVAAADDGALAVLRHDKGKRGRVDLARMHRNSILCAHVLEHAAEPVIGDGCDQVRHDPELGAAERRGDRVAAEGDCIGFGDVLFVAGRQVVGNEGDVDIGLSDKEGLHKVIRPDEWSRPAPEISTGYVGQTLKLFAKYAAQGRLSSGSRLSSGPSPGIFAPGRFPTAAAGRGSRLIRS